MIQDAHGSVMVALQEPQDLQSVFSISQGLPVRGLHTQVAMEHL